MNEIKPKQGVSSMNDLMQQYLDSLKQGGWTVERLRERTALPVEIRERYPWLPEQVRELVETFEAVGSPDEKAWVLTVSDYAGVAESAYAWNEWERMSLEAADEDGDEEWAARIREFRNHHFPIVLSLKSGYAYLAIKDEDLSVVVGEEPEFESRSA